MADLKATTVTGTLAVSSTATATKHLSTTAAAADTECIRKTEFDAAIAAKSDLTDSRFTNSRNPTGTAAGAEINGTYPDGLTLTDRTVNPALAGGGNVGPLTTILSWLAKAIKAITGTTNWFDTPATDLATTAAHIASTANPHTVTASQVGLGNLSNAAQLVAANNLSDVANAATARANLGLSGAAALAVGSTAGTVCAGDDSRLANSRTPTAHAASHHSGGSDPVRLDLLTVGGVVSLASQQIINLASPTTNTGAANKAYVDDAKGVFKTTVATTVNDSLNGIAARDGVALSIGDRVLVWKQTTALENGIYVAAIGAWSRATDADAGTELSSASLVSVSSGTLYGTSMFQLVTPGPITVGTTPLTFTRFPDTTGGVAWSGTQLIIPAAGVTDAMVGPRTVNPALATPADTGLLLQLLSWITGRIKAITGATLWTDAPATTLAAAATHIADVANPHAVTKTQVGLSAVTNNLQLTAANNLSDLASLVTARANLGLSGAAVLAVGTTAGTVAAGNDSRFAIKLGNVLWVDAVNGNNATGVRGRVDLPFLTCGAAKTAATAGDTIYVLPGTYNERDLLAANVNWFFFPGAGILYTGAGNGAIFDDGVNGTLNASAGVVSIDGYGTFDNSSGGVSPNAFAISHSSYIYATGKYSASANDYAVVQSSGTLIARFDFHCAGGVHITGGITKLAMRLLNGQSTTPSLYLEGGNTVVQIAEIGGGLNAIKFKNGDHRVDCLRVSSTTAAAVYVEAPTTTQKLRLLNATILSTLNTAAGVAVDLNSDNLVLQNCVLISNTTGTPATVSIKAAAAQNLRVYGHAMANLAKDANVTLLCGTLEVDADVTF